MQVGSTLPQCSKNVRNMSDKAKAKLGKQPSVAHFARHLLPVCGPFSLDAMLQDPRVVLNFL